MSYPLPPIRERRFIVFLRVLTEKPDSLSPCPNAKKSPVGFSYVTDGRFSALKGKYADAFGVFAIRSATVQIRYQNRYITIALCI
jgi:hypothetical protein